MGLFDICVFSSTSRLILGTIEPRYLDLFTWWVPYLLSVCIGQCDKISKRVGTNFRPKCLYRLREMDYFFKCNFEANCHEGSVVSKQELVHQNISNLYFCRFNLTGFEQVCHWSTLYLQSFGGISDGIRQEHWKKIWKSVRERTHSCFSNCSGSFSLKLSDALIPECKSDISLAKWSGHSSSVVFSITLSCSQNQKLLWSRKICTNQILSERMGHVKD